MKGIKPTDMSVTELQTHLSPYSNGLFCFEEVQQDL